MTDPCALSEAALLAARTRLRRETESLWVQLHSTESHPVLHWLEERERLAWLFDELGEVEAEIARRQRG